MVQLHSRNFRVTCRVTFYLVQSLYLCPTTDSAKFVPPNTALLSRSSRSPHADSQIPIYVTAGGRVGDWEREGVKKIGVFWHLLYVVRCWVNQDEINLIYLCYLTFGWLSPCDTTGWPVWSRKRLCWHQIQSSDTGLGSRPTLQLNATSNLEST